MPDLDFISQHQKLLAQLLDGQKELRREMLTFLTTLEEVWLKMPANLPAEDRIYLLRELTTKFMGEVRYSADVLNRRFDELFTEYEELEQGKLQITIAELKDLLNKIQADLTRKEAHLASAEVNLKKVQSELEVKCVYLSDIEAKLQNSQHTNAQFSKLYLELSELLKKNTTIGFIKASAIEQVVSKLSNQL